MLELQTGNTAVQGLESQCYSQILHCIGNVESGCDLEDFMCLCHEAI